MAFIPDSVKWSDMAEIDRQAILITVHIREVKSLYNAGSRLSFDTWKEICHGLKDLAEILLSKEQRAAVTKTD